MKVAIIGGGISGLSAAFYLGKERANGAPVEYTLFDSEPRLGGSMYSEHIDGCVVEAGPDSFLTEKPWAINLCQELGIGDQLIGSNDPLRKTYIIVKNRLIAMPDGLMFMVPTKLIPTALTRLFSIKTKIRMGLELLHPPRAVGHDETVADMVRRHFGEEVVDRLADPLLSGVYGGDAASLSVRAVLPRFVEMEEKYGSLSRAMLDAHNKMLAAKKKAPQAAPRPLFTSLKAGMQQMVSAIEDRLDRSSIRTGTAIESVSRSGSEWQIKTAAGYERYDAVVLATPAKIAGRLLKQVAPDLAADLEGIVYSSSVTVTLGYSMEQLKGLPPGFGFLVPHSEGTRMLACTFVHNKFPHRAPVDKGIIRCFLGGSKDEGVLDLSDEEIQAICIRELRKILKLDALQAPKFVRVYRWKGAMAQYTPGHIERVKRIDNAIKQIPGLAVIGNAFKGIGVPDCVRSGQEAATMLANLARNGSQVGK
jgi:protoporphyrinogen/coproporphyrinogen III oxidase